MTPSSLGVRMPARRVGDRALDAGEGRLEHFAADLADPSAVGQVIDRALEAFGGLDVLVVTTPAARARTCGR